MQPGVKAPLVSEDSGVRTCAGPGLIEREPLGVVFLPLSSGVSGCCHPRSFGLK